MNFVFKKQLLFIILINVFFYQTLFADDMGKIAGTVVDASTGEPMVGANIYLKNSTLGAAADMNGTYVISNIPPATYIVVVSVIGYTEIHIKSVIVKTGQTTKIDVALKPEILTTEVVQVEAKALHNTEASLLKDRQNSAALSDAISAEAIAEAGSDNAADALKQVTGASVVDGKYIYVRGLGDRYTSTMLNGAEMPSTNPYKKTASIDLIPSNLVDNIVTIKSFTPDKPGDFAGGSVDIRTKDFPDRFQVNATLSSSFNTQTTLKQNGSLGFNAGNTDWLGLNDGTLDLPSLLSDKNVKIPNIGEANNDPAMAKQLIAMTNSFNKQLGPVNLSAPVNRSLSISTGNQILLFNRPLGYLASFSYNRGFSGYNNGIFRRWVQGSRQVMANVYDLKEQKTSQDVLWGSLFKLAYKISPDHIISVNGIYNKSSEITARNLTGSYPYDMDESRIFQASVLNFSERTLINGQLKGEHYLPVLFDTRFDWMLSVGKTTEAQPDQRYFNSFYDTKNNAYGIKDNTPPSRYFRNLNEDKNQFTLNFKTPFSQWDNLKGYVKFGGLYIKKHRNYSERLFQLVDNQGFSYNGDPNSLLNDSNVGIVDTTITTIRGVDYKSYKWGVVVQENKLPGNNYNADQEISASYLMFELPILRSLRMIGGARYESTNMGLVTSDSTLGVGRIKARDLLPSLNFVYNIVPDMNLRFSYSKTLARPTFREIGQFATFDFMGGDVFVGNPNLKQSRIDNYDLRWEWFSRPGEIYAISAFSKTFKNPIERVFNSFEENTWKNVDFARAYGLELEVRKRLDVLQSSLNNFTLGANLSLIRSQVQISADELRFIHNLRPEASSTRPFQGQSPYLVNFNLSYDNPELGLKSSLYYNVFGTRLSKVSYGGTPDVYEGPSGLLNISLNYKIWEHTSFKLSGKNLLNPEYEKFQEFKGQKYIYSRYKHGRSFSIGVSYNY